jgi:Ni,Fe-hydrogenase III small subunit
VPRKIRFAARFFRSIFLCALKNSRDEDILAVMGEMTHAAASGVTSTIYMLPEKALSRAG